MMVDDAHVCRRVDVTPQHWKTQGWKVEYIRRTSSNKLDILITTPPPTSQKIRSLKGLHRFISEHKVTTLGLEHFLTSRKQKILWKNSLPEGICQCGVPTLSSTPNCPQLAPVVEESRDCSSSNELMGQDGTAVRICDQEDTIDKTSLAIRTELGFEFNPKEHEGLLRVMTRNPGGQSAELVTETNILDVGSDSKVDESHVKCVSECDDRYVVHLSEETVNVPLKSRTVCDYTVAEASVVGDTAEEVEDQLSVVDGQSADTSHSVHADGEEASQSQDVACSPERVQRRIKNSQCASPYFRKGGNVASSLPPCALRRNNKWLPPRSPFGLIQEELYHDPFQLLVATILLNKTRGEMATPVIWKLLGRWPTPETVLEAAEEDMVSVIRPLGLHKKRAFIIKKFAEEFLHKQWTYPDELYGISKYGTDSYRIFCVNEWRDAKPTDHMLLKYVKWLAKKQV